MSNDTDPPPSKDDRKAETGPCPSDIVSAGPHYRGHRARLRRRFLDIGADGLDDYELLELLLFAAIPQRDVKPLAKELLSTFGDLWGVVNAPQERLRRFAHCKDTVIATLRVTGAIALRMGRSRVLNRPVLSSWQRLLDYCHGILDHESVEQFRLLFLDRRNVLIADEVHQRGTIDHTPVYPREVLKRALDLGAASLILVHNHPSGDPTPSRADIEMTREIVKAAAMIGITVHDHLVIGRQGHASFKSLGLL